MEESEDVPRVLPTESPLNFEIPKEVFNRRKEEFEQWFFIEKASNLTSAFCEIWESNDLMKFLSLKAFTDNGRVIVDYICKEPKAFIGFFRRNIACETKTILEAIPINDYNKRYEGMLKEFKYFSRIGIIRAKKLGESKRAPWYFAPWYLSERDFKLLLAEKKRITNAEETKRNPRVLKIKLRDPLELVNDARIETYRWKREKGSVNSAFREVWESNNLIGFLDLLAFDREGDVARAQYSLIWEYPELFLATFAPRLAYNLHDVMEALDIDEKGESSRKYRDYRETLTFLAAKSLINSEQIEREHNAWVFAYWDLTESEFMGYVSYKALQYRRKELLKKLPTAGEWPTKCQYPNCHCLIKSYEEQQDGSVICRCKYPKHQFTYFSTGEVELLFPVRNLSNEFGKEDK